MPSWTSLFSLNALGTRRPEHTASRFGLNPHRDTALGSDRQVLRPSIVVVGNGMVGANFCHQMVQLGLHEHYKITVIGEEPVPAYDRVHLTDYMSDNDLERLTIYDRGRYEAHGIDLIVDDLVTTLNSESLVIKTHSGRTVPYDYTVLATGSYPFVPSLPGLKGHGVFVYRTLSDLDTIKQFVNTGARRVAVLGGGLLGLEAAQAMVALGLEAHVIEVAHHLMPQQLDPGAGDCLLQHILRQRVSVHLAHRAVAINHHSDGLEILFDKREQSLLQVDMILVSTGIRARTDLAERAGLSLSPSRGIVVDNYLTTSDPRIFAIGECACHDGTMYGLVQPGYQMAETVARNFGAMSSQFKKGNISTRLKMMGVDVATVGDYAQPGRTLTFESEGIYRKLVLRNGSLIGAVGVGEWPEVTRIQTRIDQQDTIPERELKLFYAEGYLTEPTGLSDVWAWSDDTLVCNCMRVTKGQICAAIKDGASTPETISACTSAGTLCGSCKPIIGDLCGTTSRETIPDRSPWLLRCCIVVLTLLVIFMLAPPAQFATSVNATWHQIDVLWRDGYIKQVSGYTLLGLCVLALLLSLRKRIKRFSHGAFDSWRFAHAAVGLLALLMLIGHTGFRLGQNFNFYLMSCFLGLNILGGIAGMASSLERNPNGTMAQLSRRYRPLLTWCHIIFLWPLPALLGLHIWMVYYY